MPNSKRTIYETVQDADRDGRDDIYVRGSAACGRLHPGRVRRPRGPRGCDTLHRRGQLRGFGRRAEDRDLSGGRRHAADAGHRRRRGSTFFTDGDRLGLFLRGDGYEDVDNRIVQLDYPGEGPQKKWKITGEAIPLYADAATVTAYFPYSDAYGLTMSAVPLNSGLYDVNTNDVVWQRDTVHSTHTQAMFLEMQHAMTRVKIRLNRGTSDTSDSGDYTGEGKITASGIADAGDVAADDRVVYLDGTLDLTQATPVVTPGWPDAVADKSEKTLTAEGVLYDLLLLPVDKIDAGKVMLEVELDGKSLSAPFPVDAVDKWEAGKAYTYEVAVRNGAAQVVFGKATVTPWNDGGASRATSTRRSPNTAAATCRTGATTSGVPKKGVTNL